MVIKNCVICGKEFEAKYNNKTCSVEHSKNLKKMNWLRHEEKRKGKRKLSSSRRYLNNKEMMIKKARQWTLNNPEKRRLNENRCKAKKNLKRTNAALLAALLNFQMTESKDNDGTHGNTNA